MRPSKPDTPACPRCQGQNTSWLAMRSTANPDHNFYVCNGCGNIWATEKPPKDAA